MRTVFTIASAALLLTGTSAMAQDTTGASPMTGDVPEAAPPPVDAQTTEVPSATTDDFGAPADEGLGADATQPAPMGPEAAPMPDAGGAEFSDAQITGYVSAAMGVQELQADTTLDDAAMQAQAATILADSGLDPETFNAISDAVRTDPAVAERVQLAMANHRGTPGA